MKCQKYKRSHPSNYQAIVFASRFMLCPFTEMQHLQKYKNVVILVWKTEITKNYSNLKE